MVGAWVNKELVRSQLTVEFVELVVWWSGGGRVGWIGWIEWVGWKRCWGAELLRFV